MSRVVGLYALIVLVSASIPAPAQTKNASISCKYTSFEASKKANLGSDANGLNNSDKIVGIWQYENEYYFLFVHGFMRDPDGKITQLSYPHVPNTFLNGINDAGTVVGYFQKGFNNTSSQGFSWANGQFTKLQYPDSVYTNPYGINDKGDIVGWYALPQRAGAAFLYSGGQFSSIAYPGAFSTTALGINKSGVVVGYWQTNNVPDSNAFIYENGKFTSVSYPNMPQTVFSGINDSGAIVGYFVGPGPDYTSTGFFYQNGKFNLVKIPKSFSSRVLGINNKGDIVGFYAIKNVVPNYAFLGTGCH